MRDDVRRDEQLVERHVAALREAPRVMPNAGALAATARPMRPRPMMPSCLPRSSVPSMKSSAQPFQPPRRTSRSPSPMRRVDREDQRPGQLGGRLGEHVRRVGDDDAARAAPRRRRCCRSRRRCSRRPSSAGAASSTPSSTRSVSTQISPRLSAHPRAQLVGVSGSGAFVEIDVAAPPRASAETQRRESGGSEEREAHVIEWPGWDRIESESAQ